MADDLGKCARRDWRATWPHCSTTSGGDGFVSRVVHQIGILAGAALLADVLGNFLLYAVALLLSIPLFNRLRRRFGTWKAPVMGVAIFTAMFLLSALVIGPAISRSSTPPAPQSSVGPAGDVADHAPHPMPSRGSCEAEARPTPGTRNS